MVILQTNRGSNCFFEVCEVNVPGNYEIKMLQNNSLKYVPPTEMREIDGRKSLYVKIDGLGTLVNQFRRSVLEKKDLEKLLQAIKGCMLELKDYLLGPGGMIIDMEHILYSPEEDNYKFMYIPGLALSFRDQMKNLFEEIMRIFDHKDREGVVYLYDIYSHFLVDNFTPDIFCKMVKGEDYTVSSSALEESPSKAKVIQKAEENRQINDFTGINNDIFFDDKSITIKESKKAVNKNTLMILCTAAVAIVMYLILGAQSLMISAVLALIMAAYFGVDMIRKKEEEETRRSMEPILDFSYYEKNSNQFSETDKEKNREEIHQDYASEINMDSDSITIDTTILSENNNFTNSAIGISKLIPCEGNKESPILLIEGETRVGRMPEVCDICIDTPEISRVHAILEKKGKDVTLKDVGSTNGTYINDHRLKKDKSEKLKSGDVINLAGFTYECR